MAQKDLTEKTLEAYNDVFSDIINVLVFQGKPVVREDELEDASPMSMFKADGKLHEQERDVSKYWKRPIFVSHFSAWKTRRNRTDI